MAKHRIDKPLTEEKSVAHTGLARTFPRASDRAPARLPASKETSNRAVARRSSRAQFRRNKDCLSTAPSGLRRGHLTILAWRTHLPTRALPLGLTRTPPTSPARTPAHVSASAHAPASAHALASTFAPILALILTLALAPFLASCSLLTDNPRIPSENATPRIEARGPYYDQSAFHRSGGRYSFDDGTVIAGKTGIDVSDHQDEIDWNAVAANNIEFAFLRVGYRGTTEGGLFPDERFAANLQGAREVGIACGAYFFSQATTVAEAEEEATFVLNLLNGTQLEYPVAFDYEIVPETRIAHVNTETATQVAEAFCTTIRAGGYEPILYGNTFDLARFSPQLLDASAIWCAEYDDGPSYERKANIWQYTNQGIVEGISGLCDLNLDLTAVP